MLIEGLIDIGLAVLLFLWLWCVIKKLKIGQPERRFFYFFNVMLFLLSMLIIGQINFAGDEITLIATREVGSQSNSNEVFLDHFVIDGREKQVTQIVQGKWYFNGNGIYWNDDSAHPELEGQTDAVVIRMPVGIKRQMYFSMNDYRGYVQVYDGTEMYEADTSVTECIQLESSPLWKIAGTYVIRCLLVIAVMTVGSFFYLYVLKKCRYARDGRYHLVALPLCILVFIFMWYNGDKQCFWIDELYQLAYISGNLGDVLKISINSISDPPIYNTLAWIWYQIVPHTEKWLLLLPELLTLTAIYLMGYFATIQRGIRLGVVTLILAVTAERLYLQVAFENRQYALWFLLCILLFEAHRRFVEVRSTKKMWIYILLLVLTVLTQYLSIFLCLAFFICDIIIWRKEKETGLLFPYFFGFVAALPFAITILVKYLQNYSGTGSAFLEFWANVPDMNKVVDTLLYLLKDNMFWLFLLAFGCAHIILRVVDGKAKWQEWILLEIPVLFFLLNYFYSVCVNRAGSMWVQRYFTMVLPQIIMICALEVEYLIWHWSGKSRSAARTMLIGVGLFFGIQCWNNVAQKVSSEKEPYKEAADWLYNQTATIYKPTTLVIDCEDVNSNKAWYSYYLTKEGLRDDINCVSYYEVDMETLTNYEKIYVVHLHGAFEENEQLERILSQYYKKGGGKSSLDIREYKRRN